MGSCWSSVAVLRAWISCRWAASYLGAWQPGQHGEGNGSAQVVVVGQAMPGGDYSIGPATWRAGDQGSTAVFEQVVAPAALIATAGYQQFTDRLQPGGTGCRVDLAAVIAGGGFRPAPLAGRQNEQQRARGDSRSIQVARPAALAPDGTECCTAPACEWLACICGAVRVARCPI